MKRIIALMMALVMIMGCLVACGAKESDSTTEDLAVALEVLDEAQDLLQEAEALQEELKENAEMGAPAMEETSSVETEEAEQPEETEEKTDDGMRPEFKEAMNSYEAFMDEYVAFMKKYNENPSDLSLLADYSTYLVKYAEFVEDFDKWEDGDMNNAEMSYYIEVQNRVSKKLLEVAE